MPTYKNISNDDIELLYEAVSSFFEIPLLESIELVDEYLQGKLNTSELLSDIDNELSWIPGERDNLQNAIDNVIPGLAVPANVRAVLTGLAENQRRILQEQLRELKAWKWWIKNGKRE